VHISGNRGKSFHSIVRENDQNVNIILET